MLTNPRLLNSQGKSVVSVKGGCIDGLDWKSAIHIWTKSAMVPIPEGADTEEDPPAPSHNQVDSGQTLDAASSSSSGSLNHPGSGSSGDARSIISSSDSTSTTSTSPPSSMVGSDLAAYYRRVADMLD